MRATEFLTEELQGLTVEAQPTPTGGWVVSAYLDENEIGWTRFQKTGSGKFKASMAFVSEKMRRQGVARAIYAYARQQLGLDIIPSDSQSSDATAFWKSGAATVDEQVQPELTNGEGFEHTVDRNGITLKAASNGHGALQIKAFVQGKKA
jgi:predicted GNAT family acetyltransferase